MSQTDFAKEQAKLVAAWPAIKDRPTQARLVSAARDLGVSVQDIDRMTADEILTLRRITGL